MREASDTRRPAARGRRWTRLVVTALGVALAALPARASGEPPRRRGPVEWREEWLLAQPRLTLPASGPDLVRPGETRLRLDFDWGNDFGWSPGTGAVPLDQPRYLVDGEHRSLALTVRRGLTPRLELGLRLPLRWRGGGVLDGAIQWVHDLGFPDNARDSFPSDRLRVEGRRPDGAPLRWRGAGGTGLGRLELDLRGGLLGGPAARGWTLSAIGRVGLPTGAGTFASDGLELGAQLLAARGLGEAFDLYLGAGVTHFAEDELQGIRYQANRGHGFVALEWRPQRSLSLLLQLDVASRLVVDVDDYPGVQSYLRVAARVPLGERWEIEGGFSENVSHQQATTDFSVGLGITRAFGGR